MKKSIDVNCDMGEAFGYWKISDVNDEEIMPYISSANVATGFHAGDPNHMDRLVQLACKYKVNVGAHTGYRDLQGFGRRKIHASVKEIVNDVVYQIGAMREFCSLYGISLNHIKPHGALYMEMAANRELATAFIEAMQKIGKNIPIYCMGDSETHKVALEKGHPVVREFYADREYGDNGAIVFTRRVGKFDAEAIKNKVLMACLENKVKTVAGNTIPIKFESICFHSDTPGSLEIASKLQEGFQEKNITLATLNP